MFAAFDAEARQPVDQCVERPARRISRMAGLQPGDQLRAAVAMKLIGDLFGVERTANLAGDSDAAVMSFDAASDEIAVSAHHADRGDYTDAIGIAEGKWDGAPLAIHFNGRYVAEALNTSSADRVDLMMPPDGKNAELMPFVVVIGETRGTIMPMRPK